MIYGILIHLDAAEHQKGGQMSKSAIRQAISVAMLTLSVIDLFVLLSKE